MLLPLRCRFGDITKSLLESEWGKTVVSQAQTAGRNLTGRADYQVWAMVIC